jgi:formylglycine-generating enzyme required for sulfatase activity
MRKISIGFAALALAACGAGKGEDKVFRDCADCPEMVIVPPGEFTMGSPAAEEGRFDDEGPQHRVTIAKPFAVSKYPVTRAAYAAFAKEKDPQAEGCMAMTDEGWKEDKALGWRSPGFAQDDDHPVVCISWNAAQAYVKWLSVLTDHQYRFLSEAEFEYAARAGATTPYPWGDDASEACKHANGFDLSAKRGHPDWASMECDDGYAQTSPVGAFPANAFGLYGMTGNVFQWTEDCFAEGYDGAPDDGSARTGGDCNIRVIRGGSWLNSAKGLRPALRDRDPATGAYTNIGIRLARDL